MSQNRGGVSEMTAEHEDFVSRLPDKDKTLLMLRDQLYEGSWQEMVMDLEPPERNLIAMMFLASGRPLLGTPSP